MKLISLIALLALALSQDEPQCTLEIIQLKPKSCNDVSSRSEVKIIWPTPTSDPTLLYAADSMISFLNLRSITRSNFKCIPIGNNKMSMSLRSTGRAKKSELSYMKTIKECYLTESSIWPLASPLQPRRAHPTQSDFWLQVKSPNSFPCSTPPPYE